jgi:hypothetical protein
MIGVAIVLVVGRIPFKLTNSNKSNNKDKIEIMK